MRCLRMGAWLAGAFVLTTVFAAPAAPIERRSIQQEAAPENPPENLGTETETVPAGPLGGFASPATLGYADFAPQSAGSDDCHYDVPSEDNGGFVSADSPGGVCCLVAGVHLPEGATVTSVFFYLRDASAGDVTLSLRRKRIDDESTSTAMGTASTSGTGSGVRIFSDVSIAQGLVDNRHYTYFVSTDTCLDQDLDLRLLSALVFFSEGS